MRFGFLNTLEDPDNESYADLLDDLREQAGSAIKVSLTISGLPSTTLAPTGEIPRLILS